MPKNIQTRHRDDSIKGKVNINVGVNIHRDIYLTMQVNLIYVSGFAVC